MIYQPAEDSYLLLDVVKKFARGKVLEIGTATGILSEGAASKKNVEKVLALDINPECIKYCKKNIKSSKIKFIVSDMYSKVKGKFDTVMFNPPYLPLDKREDAASRLATTGGKKGHELFERFIDGVNEHLEENGQVITLFSTLTGKKKVEEILDNNLLDYEKVAEKKIPFETLFVYLLTKNNFLKIFEKKGVKKVKKFTKGSRGLIYTGFIGKKKVAMKIQRQDIGASGTVNNESKRLKILNKKGIGPKLLFSGEDYFVYDFVEGQFILDYFETANKKQIKKVIIDVLHQMEVLDLLFWNKEEMHHPLKHIIVNKKGKSVLLDFERCKETHKPQNVTQWVQFITSGHVSNIVKFNKKKLMELSREYKHELQRKGL